MHQAPSYHHISIAFLFLTRIAVSVISFKTNGAVFYRSPATQATVLEPKNELLNIFDAESSDEIFSCPQSLNPVSKITRIIGFSEERFWTVSDFDDIRYPVRDGINDFTIKSEIEKPSWSMSRREQVGQGLFQTSFIPYLYERSAPSSNFNLTYFK
jgi:hypothetical protein